MSQVAIVLALWLALNLGVVLLACLRYAARARWLRARVAEMIDAAERHANSQTGAGVGAGSGRLPD